MSDGGTYQTLTDPLEAVIAIPTGYQTPAGRRFLADAARPRGIHPRFPHRRVAGPHPEKGEAR